VPTAPDPLAGDVSVEPAPRAGWRRLTPWLAALIAVVVVVGWQVVSRNPKLEAEGTTWSSPATVACGDGEVSLHRAADENVKDGSTLYAVLVRNSSQFPVKMSADQPKGFRVGFTGVVDASAPEGSTPGTTSASVSVPTGQTAWLVVSASSPSPELSDGGSVEVDAVRLHTVTLGTTTSHDFALPEPVVIHGAATPPAELGCS